MFGEDHRRTSVDWSAKVRTPGGGKTRRSGLSLGTVCGGEPWQSAALASVSASVQMVAAALQALMSPPIASVGVLAD